MHLYTVIHPPPSTSTAERGERSIKRVEDFGALVVHSRHSMQLLVVLAALMGVLFSVRAAAVLPVDDRSSIHVNRELSKERKELILKLVSGLLDGSLDSNMLPGEAAPVDFEEPLESRLEERAVYNRLSLPQRDRKAPCKNFFWKTFTSC
ncbi:hypothetical protein OJAV_G00064160 [Oryzias javanicus]|uniref:Somatostatin/Cortistatin C-terminal domain-containing protein n=1 Tax=Oryzias javanicus TaxID=123683 RepID=A0A3S2PM49_ORYJA|nr:hypothetical protein OJAV_G00064160 [Oryzias javanicus]